MALTAGAAAGAAIAGAGTSSAARGAFGLLGDYLHDSRALYAQEEQNKADLFRQEQQNKADLYRDSLSHQYDLDNAQQKFIYDTALAQQQHDYETHKFQDALADMKAAGLNPGAMGSSGFSAPSVTYGGSAKSVSSNFNLPGDSNFQAALFNFAKKHPSAFSETYKEIALSNAKAVKTYMKSKS